MYLSQIDDVKQILSNLMFGHLTISIILRMKIVLPCAQNKTKQQANNNVCV